MSKTLLFTLEYPPFKGGVAAYYGCLAKYYPEPMIVLDNSRNELLGARWPFLKWLPSVNALWRAVKKGRVEHILVGQILPLGLPALLVAKILKTKYSVFLHGLDISLAGKPGRKRFLTKIILKNAEKIICANNRARAIAAGLTEETKKIIVINPGIDIWEVEKENYQPEALLPEGTILLSVGRLIERKGFDMAIKSLPLVLKEVPELTYFILGGGEYGEELKGLAKKLGVEKNVVFLGPLADQEKFSYLSACDIFIMPAREIGPDFEGFGIVYLEAGLFKKPVIAGRSGGVEEAIKHGENGLLVDPENEKEIADSIIRLAKDEKLRKWLGEAGRKKVEREFSCRAMAEKLSKNL